MLNQPLNNIQVRPEVTQGITPSRFAKKPRLLIINDLNPFGIPQYDGPAIQGFKPAVLVIFFVGLVVHCFTLSDDTDGNYAMLFFPMQPVPAGRNENQHTDERISHYFTQLAIMC